MTTLPYPYGSGTGQLLENVSVGYRTDGPLLHDGEPRTAANINRAIDAVAQNVDTIWQRMTSDYHPLAVPRTYSYTVPAGPAISGFTVPYKVFVGRSSDSGVLEISDIIAITDSQDRPLIVDNQTVTVLDVMESASGPSVFCVPSSGFYESPYLFLSHTVPSGTLIKVHYGKMSDLDSLEPADFVETPQPFQRIGWYMTIKEGLDGTRVGDLFATVSLQLSTSEPIWSPWAKNIGGSPDNTMLIDTDGTVVVYSLPGSTDIIGLNPSSGNVLWTKTMSAEVLDLVVASGRVFVAIKAASSSVVSYETTSGGSQIIYSSSPDLSGKSREYVKLATNALMLVLAVGGGDIYKWSAFSGASLGTGTFTSTGRVDLAVDDKFMYLVDDGSVFMMSEIDTISFRTDNSSLLVDRIKISGGRLICTRYNSNYQRCFTMNAGLGMWNSAMSTSQINATSQIEMDFYNAASSSAVQTRVSPYGCSDVYWFPGDTDVLIMRDGTRLGTTGNLFVAACTDGWYMYGVTTTGYIYAYQVGLRSRMFVNKGTNYLGSADPGKQAEVVR